MSTISARAVHTDSQIAHGRTIDTLQSESIRCFHCGTSCRTEVFEHEDKSFCCRGCLTVFELLSENGLSDFYNLADSAGVRVKANTRGDQFKYLDEPLVRERLVNFQDDKITRVTFRLPAIHCIACVWLLENLFRLKPGIGASQVNFPRKEAAITFENDKVKLSELVTLLASLGYEPELKLSDLDKPKRNPAARQLWLQLGYAGFAFGNLMLFSLSTYFGLDAFSGPMFRKLVGYLSLALAVPVATYSALYYWRTACITLKQKRLAIEVPIAAGIAAIFSQSTFEVLSGTGGGYFDSLCGLIFFLLCGRLFQQKTYERLSFERDYKSFFPLSVTRKADDGAEHSAALAQLEVGDHLVIRNGELIPADARLSSGAALIDYSFVTGESEPVARQAGDHLYAGGRQIGASIEVETLKAVSQSYLTSLWNQEAFRKDKAESLNTLINVFSYRFTKLVIAIAIGAAAFWIFRGDMARGFKAFTSVLIVACPCALALASPFALGTAIRALGRRNVFVKNPETIEALARVNSIVFDKTGTLTASGAGSITFTGAPLRLEEERWIHSITRQSTHPLSVRIAAVLSGEAAEDQVRSFSETAGCGVEGVVAGHDLCIGSAVWLQSRKICDLPAHEPREGVAEDFGRHRRHHPSSMALLPVEGRREPVSAAAGSRVRGAHFDSGKTLHDPRSSRGKETHFVSPKKSESPYADCYTSDPGSLVHIAIDGRYRGAFVLASAVRPEVDELISKLAGRYELALLSGDNEREHAHFAGLFGDQASVHFNQSPLGKFEYVQQLQRSGKTVMMVGDGLNDAGALKQSDVGVAVVESISAFSPASDIIMSAGMVPRMEDILRFSRSAVRVVRASFLISSLYNVIGISIAAAGLLAPVVCAILMPLSSITVAVFASGLTTWAARKLNGKASVPVSRDPFSVASSPLPLQTSQLAREAA